MEPLNIEKTLTTPEIRFNTTGDLLIRGISIPDNVQNFYQPVFDWVKSLINSKPSHINLVFEVDYLNTSSSRIIVKLISLLSEEEGKGIQIKIIWRYEEGDEDMLEFGNDLQTCSRSDMIFEVVNQV